MAFGRPKVGCYDSVLLAQDGDGKVTREYVFVGSSKWETLYGGKPPTIALWDWKATSLYCDREPAVGAFWKSSEPALFSLGYRGDEDGMLYGIDSFQSWLHYRILSARNE